MSLKNACLAAAVGSNTSAKMPPEDAKEKACVRRLPPMPQEELLCDIYDRQWVLGAPVAEGTCAVVYVVYPKAKASSNQSEEHIVKIEPSSSGSILAECSFYFRVPKKHYINDWCEKMGMDYLAVPKYVAHGFHNFGGKEYRFMVMQRLGASLDDCLRVVGNKFSEDTVCYLALRLLEAVEFLHESGYAHGNIRKLNVLTGLGCDHAHKVYLVNYSTADRLGPVVESNAITSVNVRGEDTSAHTSSENKISRRGDLEMLGYCLLSWSGARLPWDGVTCESHVDECRRSYHDDVPNLMKDSFQGSDGPGYLQAYMTAVYNLNFTDKPSYARLRKLFSEHLRKRDPRKSLEWLSHSLLVNNKSNVAVEINERMREVVPVKVESMEVEEGSKVMVKPDRTVADEMAKTTLCKMEKLGITDVTSADLDEDDTCCTPTPRKSRRKIENIQEEVTSSAIRRSQRNVGKPTPRYK